MVVMAAQGKRSVQASILLVLVVGLVTPAYADTLRYDFDNLSPWIVHRLCVGIGPPGPWFVNVEDGVVKVKDGGCGIGSRTGIYHIEPWTDYEVKTRIQVRSLGPGGVKLFIRAVRWCLGRIGEEPGPCRWDAPGGEIGFQGNTYRIWRDNPVNAGQWYDVRIVAEGDRIRYFLNGRKVSEQAAGRMSGGVAFTTEMSEFWLDYVEITSINTFPVQPQGRLATCWATLKGF
jgi:hypothetical protein